MPRRFFQKRVNIPPSHLSLAFIFQKEGGKYGKVNKQAGFNNYSINLSKVSCALRLTRLLGSKFKFRKKNVLSFGFLFFVKKRVKQKKTFCRILLCPVYRLFCRSD